KRPDAVPILMAHGWPDSFLRYAKTFQLLSDYSVVVPSMPGFAFSTLPEKGYINNTETADLYVQPSAIAGTHQKDSRPDFGRLSF
ncbi:MAG: alpha/beta hydrolase, partial [Muribaculaceae bacterium]|nr:alpha/beta hydrolase [Muribaculaceae bacterium]